MTARIAVVVDGQFPLHSHAGLSSRPPFQLECTDCALNHSPKAWSLFSCCGQKFITTAPHAAVGTRTIEDKRVYLFTCFCNLGRSHKATHCCPFHSPRCDSSSSVHLGFFFLGSSFSRPCSTHQPCSQSRFMSKPAWSTERPKIVTMWTEILGSIFRKPR